ncbi:hypothetical protein Godav_000985, partial [Gossypium davidsonii]|nr:hypothetical protein [Gossypium davidsonii]
KASTTAKLIEEETFLVTDASFFTDEDNIEILRLYSKEINKRLICVWDYALMPQDAPRVPECTSFAIYALRAPRCTLCVKMQFMCQICASCAKMHFMCQDAPCVSRCTSCASMRFVHQDALYVPIYPTSVYQLMHFGASLVCWLDDVCIVQA